jgi:hypothetical protein
MHPRRWMRSRPVDIVKIVWAAVAAPVVCAVWLALFTVREVYGGDVNMAVAGAAGLVVHCGTTLVLVWALAAPKVEYTEL